MPTKKKAHAVSTGLSSLPAGAPPRAGEGPVTGPNRQEIVNQFLRKMLKSAEVARDKERYLLDNAPEASSNARWFYWKHVCAGIRWLIWQNEHQKGD